MGEKPCFFFLVKYVGRNVLLCMYNDNNIDVCIIKMYMESEILMSSRGRFRDKSMPSPPPPPPPWTNSE